MKTSFLFVSVPIRGLFNLTSRMLILLGPMLIPCFRPHQGII